MITSAERARHAAWVTSTQPAWSPAPDRGLTPPGRRHQHGDQPPLRDPAPLSGRPHRRQRHPRAQRRDCSGPPTPPGAPAPAGCTSPAPSTRSTPIPCGTWPATAGEAGDLALCTGRLAYADAAWTLSSGPGHQPRPPHDLAPDPGDVPLALAAAHHACDAVTSLAYAQRERIRTAASAGLALVPPGPCPPPWTYHARSRPPSPTMFYALLRLCQGTAEAAAEAAAQAGEAAAAARAPSHLLTAARAAAHAGRDASTSPQHPVAPEPAVTGHPREGAGEVQAALRRRGVTSPDLLQRAADIDRASEQLIIEAAGQRGRPTTTQPRNTGQISQQPSAHPRRPPLRRHSRAASRPH